MLSCKRLNPLVSAKLYRDGGSGEGQAEQHQQRDDLVVGVDVGKAQAAVVAVEARLRWLKHIRPLQEVQADHRGHQDRQLRRWRGDGRAEAGGASTDE